MGGPSFVLMGSGEFLPWARQADRWALDVSSRDSDRVLVLPAASAPEGDPVFDRWGEMGLRHFEALGVRPEVVPLKTREDAGDAAIVSAFEDARYIFLSGGNPAYLVKTLEGTAAWQAILTAAGNGVPLGGCSAGMVALGIAAPDTAGMSDGAPMGVERVRKYWAPALKLFPAAYFQAHWDALDGYYPGLRKLIVEAQPEGSVLFALDEDTAACGDGTTWMVVGEGALTIDEGRQIRAGTAFDLPLDPRLQSRDSDDPRKEPGSTA